MFRKFKYVFNSGFGFKEDYWQNIKPYFGQNFISFNKITRESFKNYEGVVGIGHSLGFLELNNSNIEFTHLIGLQSFLNFCGNESKMHVVRLKNLNKVIKEFEVDHIKALDNFHQACGGELSKNTPRDVLLSDLNKLKQSYTHCGVKTLIVGTEEDEIVPISLIRDNFEKNNNIVIKQIKGCGHSLGYHKEFEVFNLIKSFVEGNGDFKN